MSAYTAEYGLKGGAQVNFITKRGGSEYHGTAYTYQRDTRFNSTNYFNKIEQHSEAGVPLLDARRQPRRPGAEDSARQRDGDKLFFFYSLDDTQLKDAARSCAAS